MYLISSINYIDLDLDVLGLDSPELILLQIKEEYKGKSFLTFPKDKERLRGDFLLGSI